MPKKRITKVYTKTGDKGLTSLVFGERVSKASIRVETYGDVDELNSVLGVVRSKIGINENSIQKMLTNVQNDLFVIGADLASTESSKALRLKKNRIRFLEKQIDKYLADLEPLREFILPSGSESGAMIHLARTVARRAERGVVKLMKEEKINNNILIYLNRLSDLLFVLSRIVNKNSGYQETYVDFW